MHVLNIPDASVLTGWRKSSHSGGDNGDCLEITDASAIRAWRKSTYSGGDNGECLEVADASATRAWRKSTYSGADNGDCLEVADDIPDVVPVRDSKNPHGPAVVFPATEWAAFVGAVRGGRLGRR